MQTKLAKIGLLGDVDLIATVEHRVLEHLLDANRAGQTEDRLATETVSAALDPLGVESITADIRLAKAVSDYLVEKSRRFDGYRNPRLPLHEIPKPLSSRMFWTGIAVWRKDILPQWPFDEADLDDTLETTAVRALEATAMDARRLEKAAEVADALTDAGRLSPALLPDLLRKGEIGVFEAVLARLLDLPLALVRSLTFEPGGARLAVALRAAGLAPGDFGAIHAIINDVRPTQPEEGPSAMELFDRCAPEAAGRVVRHWRRQPEYLAALRQYASVNPDDA